MSDPVPGHNGRPQEPQCYNCGSLGHWAVACPEPTRETPAGLTAWRNSSAGQGNGKGTNPGPKRSKGPIITKYAPPLPQQQPPYGPAMAHYAPPPPPPPPPLPLPPGNHQPPGLYPGPSPPYQHYVAPPAPFPAGYHHQAVYAYHSHQYSPYGPPHYAQPGYMAPPPGPPPPPPPAATGSFPPARPHATEYRPPPPPYTQPYPHAAAHGPGSSPHSGGPSYVRPGGPSPRPAPVPPKPASARISHPLPPKPPPSHDQIKPQRDHRNRRKHERHHNHQDKRHRDPKPSVHKPHNQGSQYDVHRPVSSAGRHSSKNSPTRGRLDQAAPRPSSPKGGRPDEAAPRSSTPDRHHAPRSPDKRNGQPEAKDGPAKAGEQAATVSESAVSDGDGQRNGAPSPSAEKGSSSRLSDEADRPSVEPGKEDSPQACTADAGGDAPDSTLANGEAAESTRSSPEKEDGEIPSEETMPSPPRGRAWSDVTVEAKGKSPVAEGQESGKRGRGDESDHDERGSKKPKPDSPQAANDRSSDDGGLNGSLWDSVPRQADRKRQGSTASRGSRRSSISSKSSDLNSLEAELLGRPVKQRQSEPSPSVRQQRPERKAPLKAKRRQANTNSAYSRRW